jgi:hypothetical protein
MEPREQIGRFRRRIDVSIEYARLAREDEQAANLLAESGHYRQAVYFVLQAMEKHLRAEIFKLVDPTNDYFRQANRNHSVEDAAIFLVEAVASDEHARAQIREQLDRCLFGGQKFNLLHNDLRYPAYFDKTASYSCLDISSQDLLVMFGRLDWLKEFLRGLDLLR